MTRRRRRDRSPCRTSVEVTRTGPRRSPAREVVFEADDVGVNYGKMRAIDGVSLKIYENLITAMIGPSGCGKSTFLRCLNRMNDTVARLPRRRARSSTTATTCTATASTAVEVRRRIGMVFQRPNPFPKSIFDNIAWAPRILGMKNGLDERVEKALRGAALWDEVKDRLKQSALGLSGGQQQRLCIARAHRHRARRAAARRAGLGARPDRHGQRSRSRCTSSRPTTRS